MGENENVVLVDIDASNPDDMYGECTRCGAPLQPVWFLDEERINGILTGRKRKACSKLLCDCCGHVEIVDDSFDGPWF